MSKFICGICGYIYNETKEGVKFADLPDNWVCPDCGAPKSLFTEQGRDSEPFREPVQPSLIPEGKPDGDMRQLTDGELAAICSNLARGCEKQYRPEESALYSELAEYFTSRTYAPAGSGADSLVEGLDDDFNSGFPAAKNAADEAGDRGAKRVLVWSEKVSRVISSIIARYRTDGGAVFKDAKIWVCDICGFVIIGNTPPAVCPVCKVPSFKILEVPEG